ncbi:response regulator [Paraburkholderia ultramafica]|uniref:response regulator n=1 Tax=Paraburkholderia ultramafica TaxID=1544867 RepID=UPI001581D8B1|nr:response regulator [Paraburkholderia ultramafica]
MIIEEDPSIRELVSLFLRDAGHRVIESSAREAVELPRTLDISVIVLDCNSPKAASAQTTIRRLRLRFPSAAVIVISGYFPAHATCHAEFASTLGAQGTLGKPFACQELIALVKTLSASVAERNATQ